ncbi:MAG: hypothetical protein Q8S21_04490 [Candidatus Paracaedibacteraceae bacterium]|nr:hypothetical protein [Candidatus Paracaedibacteraceae bacterium]
MKDNYLTSLFKTLFTLALIQSSCFSVTEIDNPFISKRNYAEIYAASLSSEETSRSSTGRETEINSPVLDQINNMLLRHYGAFELTAETYPKISLLALKYGEYPHNISFDAINTKVSLTWNRKGIAWWGGAKKPKTFVFQLIALRGASKARQPATHQDSQLSLLPVAAPVVDKNKLASFGGHHNISSSQAITNHHERTKPIPFQARVPVQQKPALWLGDQMTVRTAAALVSTELNKLLNELCLVNGIAYRMFFAPAQNDQLIRDLTRFGAASFTIEIDAREEYYFIAEWKNDRKMYALKYWN